MQKKKRRVSPIRIIILVALIGAGIYFNEKVLPTVPPLFQPTPTPTRAPESLITDAQKLEAEGKYPLAISAYKQAVQADPRNPNNFIALARLSIYTGEYDAAIENAENALLLNPSNPEAQALRGWAVGLAGDYIRAEGLLLDAIQLDPNNSAAYAYLAEIYTYMMQAGQGDLTTLDAAITASRTAVTLSPNSLEAHRARGFVLEYTSNFEEAAGEFEAAIAINPNIADLHLALGRNYYAIQEYNDAITEFSRANALNPKDPTPETLISKTYAINGDYAKAIQYSQAALADAPTDPYMYGNLGLVFNSNTQYLDAIDMLRIAIQGGVSGDGETVAGLPLNYGKVAQYYYTYGLALARSGLCGEALQIAQAVQEGLRNDEIAVYNSQEMVNICERLTREGSADVTATLPAQTTLTPEASP